MPNLLTVKRTILNKDWTLGLLYIDETVLDGYTVEDEIRSTKVKGETAIPFGKYQLGLRQSPKFSSTFLYSDSKNILIEAKDKSKYPQIKDFRNHDLIWIQNVPNFEYILIHWGNTDLDTEGCLVIGKKFGVIKGRNGVLDSRKYYIEFYQKIYKRIKNAKEVQFINYIRAS